jgi:hypothetical protein
MFLSNDTFLSDAYGVPERVVALLGKTLAKMRSGIKTKIVISTTSYSNTDDQPIFGSAESPCFCMLTSIILFNIIADISHGIAFTDPAELETLQRTMETCVDDTPYLLV